MNFKTLILATGNPEKIAEISALLPEIQCIPQQSLTLQSAEETGLSFIENAILKARHASRVAHQPALADDSGLVVEALEGQPGIYSARFAGIQATDRENIELLLERLSPIPDQMRQAYFYCAIALVRHADDPTPIVTTGQLSGLILREARGSRGFGYDPIFYLPEFQATLAELSADTKNRISHRAIALKKLLHTNRPITEQLDEQPIPHELRN